MQTSSSTQGASTSTVQVDVMKKAQDIQSQQILKVLEGAQEKSQEMTAQKTGIGKNLNIIG